MSNGPHCGQSNSPTPIANTNKTTTNVSNPKKSNTIANAQPSNVNNNNIQQHNHQMLRKILQMKAIQIILSIRNIHYLNQKQFHISSKRIINSIFVCISFGGNGDRCFYL